MFCSVISAKLTEQRGYFVLTNGDVVLALGLVLVRTSFLIADKNQNHLEDNLVFLSAIRKRSPPSSGIRMYGTEYNNYSTGCSY